MSTSTIVVVIEYRRKLTCQWFSGQSGWMLDGKFNRKFQIPVSRELQRDVQLDDHWNEKFPKTGSFQETSMKFSNLWPGTPAGCYYNHHHHHHHHAMLGLS